MHVWLPLMGKSLKSSVDADHFWRHRWHSNAHQSGSCRSGTLHAT